MSSVDTRKRVLAGSISGKGIPRKYAPGEEEEGCHLAFGQEITVSIISAMYSPKRCYEVRIPELGNQHAFLMSSRAYTAGCKAPAIFVKMVKDTPLLCTPGIEKWVYSNEYPELANEKASSY